MSRDDYNGILRIFTAQDAVVIIVQTMWKQEITVQGKR